MSLQHGQKQHRNLMILAGLAGGLWLIFGLAQLSSGPSSFSHSRMGAPVLDGFSQSRAEAQRIRFTLADESYTLIRTASGWALEETGGYPIRPDRLADLAGGLETLSYDERRTDDPNKHNRIGLGDPAEGGNGARVEIFGPDGDRMHAILIGRKNESIYVRVPDAAQTYRAAGTLPPFYNRRAWLDLDILDIDPSAIRSVRITDPENQTLYLRRPEGSDARSFRPAPPNQDDQLISRLSASTTALAVTRLSPSDVKPVNDLTTRPVAQHISETFDGLEIEVLAYREPFGLWITLRAIEAGEGARRAAAINEKADGWAFRISDYDFQDFTPLVRDIVERDLAP